MKLLKHALKIPEGYELVKRGRAQYLIRQDYREILDHIITKRKRTVPFDGSELGSTGILKGATLRKMSMPGIIDGNLVLRESLRGGILRKLLGRTFFGIHTRMFQETSMCASAMSLKLPVAEIVVAARERIAPLLYRGWMVTREIPNSQDLYSYLEKQLNTNSSRGLQEKRAIISGLAKLIARMHDVGIYHGDLHIRNILVQIHPIEDIRFCIIDFDKSRIVNKMIMGQRIRDLMRLFRSLVKRPSLAKKITHSDIERFLLVYFRDDRSARRSAEKMLRRYFWVVNLHSFWWRIFGSLVRADLSEPTHQYKTILPR